MNISTIIELVGYTGSILVVVSMLMTSLKKLRIVNTAGSVIFAVYALVIKSYPTAGMQFALIAINMYRLYKLSNTKKEYSVVKVPVTDAILPYFASLYKSDIELFFPGIFAKIKSAEKTEGDVYLIYNGANTAGVMYGTKSSDASFEIDLDYTVPAYRDCSVGKFLYNYLAQNGIKKLTMKTDVQAHINYLKKMGFNEENGTFVKNL